MSTNEFTPAKRIGLAAAGLMYLFAAPFVVAEGIPFCVFWIVVGIGLVRQMILALKPVVSRFSRTRSPVAAAAQPNAVEPRRVAPTRILEAA
jgi:hypothetical protein